MEYIKTLEPLWGSWHIDSLIGTGSFGKVYKIYKDEWGYRYESALKVISVPTKEQLAEAVCLYQGDQAAVGQYFEEYIKDIVSEIRFLYTLRGNTNVISYEDHLVQKKADAVGWDILIRMEYATPINKYTVENHMTRSDILHLGIDICSALVLFFKKRILHRDIKEENIFVCKDGNFKIGDFGIAKNLSANAMTTAMKGTPLYAAPEVLRGEKYDQRADQYALGLLMYRFLNRGRMPFMPPYPQAIKYADSEAALLRRLSGEALSMPAEAQDKLGHIILKACAPKCEDRYETPEEMKKALEQFYQGLDEKQKSEIVAFARAGASVGSGENKVEASAGLLDTEILDLSGGMIAAQKKSSSSIEDTVGMFNNCIESLRQFAPGRMVLQESICGNTPGNIMNGGIAANQETDFYFSDTGYRNYLYKVTGDDPNPKKLNNDSTWFINVLGDWLYYINESDCDYIYKIKTDGSGRHCLAQHAGSNLIVVNDTLYYCHTQAHNSIYRMNTDGSGIEKLCDDDAQDLNIYEGYIYYINKRDNDTMYRLDPASKKRIKINNYPADYMNIYEGLVCFCRKDDGNKIYRMNQDGSSMLKLNGDASAKLNYRNGYIYYCNGDDKNRIYRINDIGLDRQMLCAESVQSFCLAQDWIFYQNRNDYGQLYKMKYNAEYGLSIFPNNWIEI